MEVFGQFWGVMQVFTDFCRFWRFLVDFGRVLGAHVGGILEAKTDENWKTCVFCYIFQVSKRDADLETILGRFSWRAERQK